MATTKKAAAPKQRRVIQNRASLSPVPQVPTADLGEMVTVTVPKQFTLTRDDTTPITYPIGVQKMPRKDAEHWWSKTHGVVINGE